MKESAFESTPKFRHFKEVMRGVLAIPKTRLDELIREAKEKTSRNGDTLSPEQKRVKRKSRIASSRKKKPQ
jgi:hypothetical protein